MRHRIVTEDLQAITSFPLEWDALEGKTILVAGANGMLPAYMAETVLFLNETRFKSKATVIALVRNREKAERRFAHYDGRADLRLFVHDVCKPVPAIGPVDFVVHGASQASPKFCETDPVGTLTANVLGTYHLLELARASQCKNFFFFSTGEVYGNAHGFGVPVTEKLFGVLDPTDSRSCYAESKRIAETMCLSWMRQYGMKVGFVRPVHAFGPGMNLDDGRVFSDFVRDILENRDIRLNSSGQAKRAFCYLTDATTGFFTVLLRGGPGEAYNVSNPANKTSIADLAKLLVSLYPEKHLAFIPQAFHSEFASKAMDAPFDIAKITALGWSPQVNLETAFRRTIDSFL